MGLVNLEQVLEDYCQVRGKTVDYTDVYNFITNATQAEIEKISHAIADLMTMEHESMGHKLCDEKRIEIETLLKRYSKND